MSLCVRFEDKFGCYELFSYSTSIINNKKYEIDRGFGDTGVFKISGNIRLDEPDTQVIIVFDLDDDNNYSLTGDGLRDRVIKFIGCENWNKIILVPVYFCYETLILYSKELNKLLDAVDDNSKYGSRDAKLLRLYKRYYDYTIIRPDNLYGIEREFNDTRTILQIQKDSGELTGEISDNPWLPQTFHLSYASSLLKLYFHDFCYAKNDNGKNNVKLFKKKEDKLFKAIEQLKGREWIEGIIDSIIANPGRNKYFSKLLAMQDISELKEMTLNKTFKTICSELDEYNRHIRGIDYNMSQCKSNIETYSQMGYNSNRIIKQCLADGFSEIEIDMAHRMLEIEGLIGKDKS